MAPNVLNVEIKILFFAKAREIVGKSEGRISLNAESKIDTIYEAIETAYPDLKTLQRSFALALNEEYLPTPDNSSDIIFNLNSSDELAVIPPISGG